MQRKKDIDRSFIHRLNKHYDMVQIDNRKGYGVDDDDDDADVDTSIYTSIHPSIHRSIESLRHSTLSSSSFYRMMMIGKDMGQIMIMMMIWCRLMNNHHTHCNITTISMIEGWMNRWMYTETGTRNLTHVLFASLSDYDVVHFMKGKI